MTRNPSQLSQDFFMFVLIGIAIAVLFLLIRELVCWYFKFSKIADATENIQAILLRIESHISEPRRPQ